MSKIATNPGAVRERLPDRREHELIRFELDGFTFIAGIGRFPDGRLAECFINSAKPGSLDTYVRDTAIVASIALQFGAPADVIKHALTRNGSGEAGGPLGKLLDLLATGQGS